MCHAITVALKRTKAGSGRASARSGAVQRARARVRPTRVRASSGSARHIRGHGRPSRMSGGATVSSSTCWNMCTQKSWSA